MRCLLVLFMMVVMMLNVACVQHAQGHVGKVKAKVVQVKARLVQNHAKDYKTSAQSIPKMPPSKEYQYDDQYAIPDISVGAPENASALIIPPGSKR